MKVMRLATVLVPVCPMCLPVCLAGSTLANFLPLISTCHPAQRISYIIDITRVECEETTGSRVGQIFPSDVSQASSRLPDFNLAGALRAIYMQFA